MAALLTGVGCAPTGAAAGDEPGLTLPGGSAGGKADGQPVVSYYAMFADEDDSILVQGIGEDEGLVLSLTASQLQDGAVEYQFEWPFEARLVVDDEGNVAAENGAPESAETILAAFLEDMEASAAADGKADAACGFGLAGCLATAATCFVATIGTSGGGAPVCVPITQTTCYAVLGVCLLEML